MENWTWRRKLSFAVHLAYVVLPIAIAFGVGLLFWTDVFDNPWLAVILLVSLETVAVLGLVFHLLKVDSPFVPARHYLPLYSVATLAYEAGAYLTEKHGLYVGVGLTVFIVAVFGTLFVQSFGALERTLISRRQAAEEAAREQAQRIVEPLELDGIRRSIYVETARHLLPAQPVQVAQDPRVPLLEAELASVRRALGAYPDSDLASLATTLAKRNARLEAQEDAYRQKAADELVAVGQAMGDYDLTVLSGSTLMSLPDSPEKDAEVSRRLEHNIDRGIDWLRQQLQTPAEPEERQQPVVAARKAPGAAVMQCEVCETGTLDASSKGVASRSKWLRLFAGKLACAECRAVKAKATEA